MIVECVHPYHEKFFAVYDMIIGVHLDQGCSVLAGECLRSRKASPDGV
jgi:hypothetical protein